ncbi:hypothetical protein GCM10009574_090500 [Streptomyces asiaticus]|uniref:Transposase Helix-turn-helix domain-containing protein n=2 Tax=Streptomyces rhizosphaericus TaxID=114699 RepID=A0ABN1SK42_9ACTN
MPERVLLVAVYYRTNLTMRQLAPLFGVSPATVCRVIQRLGALLALEPVRPPQQAADRLWIVDGTLIPVRDRTVGASSRNDRFSANVQVIVDADTGARKLLKRATATRGPLKQRLRPEENIALSVGCHPPRHRILRAMASDTSWRTSKVGSPSGKRPRDET